MYFCLLCLFMLLEMFVLSHTFVLKPCSFCAWVCSKAHCISAWTNISLIGKHTQKTPQQKTVQCQSVLRLFLLLFWHVALEHVKTLTPGLYVTLMEIPLVISEEKKHEKQVIVSSPLTSSWHSQPSPVLMPPIMLGFVWMELFGFVMGKQYSGMLIWYHGTSLCLECYWCWLYTINKVLFRVWC